MSFCWSSQNHQFLLSHIWKLYHSMSYTINLCIYNLYQTNCRNGFYKMRLTLIKNSRYMYESDFSFLKLLGAPQLKLRRKGFASSRFRLYSFCWPSRASRQQLRTGNVCILYAKCKQSNTQPSRRLNSNKICQNQFVCIPDWCQTLTFFLEIIISQAYSFF